MKKRWVLPVLLLMILLTLACSFSMEGIAIGDAPEPENPFEGLLQQQTEEALGTEEAKQPPSNANSEPQNQPVIPSGSGVEAVVSGSHEYSVAATNFDCICAETANLTVDFNFKGEQVEITNSGGGTPMVYNKIGENQYKRSFMGYYILSSGEGDQVTETTVEEERHTVITLTGNGYRMENYQGASSSACCYYIFEVIK